jgi:ribonucleoside-diphosphate reductase alpha chain
LELGLADLDDMPMDDQTTLLDVPVAEEVVAEQTAPQPTVVTAAEPAAKASKPVAKDTTAPLCYNCGNQTQRAGSCYVCTACGSTTGCS